MVCPKWLGEDVSDIVVRGNIGSLDLACLDLISDNMAIDLDMFCLFVKDRVCRNVHGCLVVTVKKHELIMNNEAVQNGEEPCNFTNYCCHNTVFSLAKERETVTCFFDFPEMVTQENVIACNRAAFIHATRPIEITKGL